MDDEDWDLHFKTADNAYKKGSFVKGRLCSSSKAKQHLTKDGNLSNRHSVSIQKHSRPRNKVSADRNVKPGSDSLSRPKPLSSPSRVTGNPRRENGLSNSHRRQDQNQRKGNSLSSRMSQSNSSKTHTTQDSRTRRKQSKSRDPRYRSNRNRSPDSGNRRNRSRSQVTRSRSPGPRNKSSKTQQSPNHGARSNRSRSPRIVSPNRRTSITIGSPKLRTPPKRETKYKRSKSQSISIKTNSSNRDGRNSKSRRTDGVNNKRDRSTRNHEQSPYRASRNERGTTRSPASRLRIKKSTSLITCRSTSSKPRTSEREIRSKRSRSPQITKSPTRSGIGHTYWYNLYWRTSKSRSRSPLIKNEQERTKIRSYSIRKTNSRSRTPPIRRRRSRTRSKSPGSLRRINRSTSRSRPNTNDWTQNSHLELMESGNEDLRAHLNRKRTINSPPVNADRRITPFYNSEFENWEEEPNINFGNGERIHAVTGSGADGNFFITVSNDLIVPLPKQTVKLERDNLDLQMYKRITKTIPNLGVTVIGSIPGTTSSPQECKLIRTQDQDDGNQLNRFHQTNSTTISSHPGPGIIGKEFDSWDAALKELGSAYGGFIPNTVSPAPVDIIDSFTTGEQRSLSPTQFSFNISKDLNLRGTSCSSSTYTSTSSVASRSKSPPAMCPQVLDQLPPEVRHFYLDYNSSKHGRGGRSPTPPNLKYMGRREPVPDGSLASFAGRTSMSIESSGGDRELYKLPGDTNTSSSTFSTTRVPETLGIDCALADMKIKPSSSSDVSSPKPNPFGIPIAVAENEKFIVYDYGA